MEDWLHTVAEALALSAFVIGIGMLAMGVAWS